MYFWHPVHVSSQCSRRSGWHTSRLRAALQEGLRTLTPLRGYTSSRLRFLQLPNSGSRHCSKPVQSPTSPMPSDAMPDQFAHEVPATDCAFPTGDSRLGSSVWPSRCMLLSPDRGLGNPGVAVSRQAWTKPVVLKRQSSASPMPSLISPLKKWSKPGPSLVFSRPIVYSPLWIFDSALQFGQAGACLCRLVLPTLLSPARLKSASAL